MSIPSRPSTIVRTTPFQNAPLPCQKIAASVWSADRTGAIPVVAVTAQAMHGDRERFLAAGFDGYVSKPVNIVELVDIAKQQCDGRRR